MKLHQTTPPLQVLGVPEHVRDETRQESRQTTTAEKKRGEKKRKKKTRRGREVGRHPLPRLIRFCWGFLWGVDLAAVTSTTRHGHQSRTIWLRTSWLEVWPIMILWAGGPLERTKGCSGDSVGRTNAGQPARWKLLPKHRIRWV